tara:strand:+ start:249 stop:761 length:513 start_codon:yes stop_codon:yes gene_type:complete
MPADEIYLKVNEWIAETYKKPDEVIKFNMKSKVVVNPNFKYTLMMDSQPMEYLLSYTLSVSIRDNKYKVDYSFGDLIVEQLPEYRGPAKDWNVYGEKLTKQQWYLKQLMLSEKSLNKAEDLEKLERRIEFLDKELNRLYNEYVSNYTQAIDKMSSTYKSLEEYINSADDW